MAMMKGGACVNDRGKIGNRSQAHEGMGPTASKQPLLESVFEPLHEGCPVAGKHNEQQRWQGGKIGNSGGRC